MSPSTYRLPLLIALTAASLAACLIMAAPFSTAILGAGVLAIALHPLHRLLSARIRIPTLAAVLSCLLLVIGILLPALLLGAQIVDQARPFIDELRTAARQGALPHSLTPLIDSLRFRARLYFHLSDLDLQGFAQQLIGQLVSYAAAQSAVTARGMVLGAIQVAVMLLTFFFLVRDAGRLLPAVRDFLPLEQDQLDQLLARTASAVRATIYGGVLTGLSQGVLGWIAFLALGLPSALLWAVLLAVVAIIPMLGAPLVWIPVAIYYAIQGLYWKSIALAIWGVIIIYPAEYVIRPVVIGASIRLHPLPVFFSAFGGLFWLGPLGLLIGPVIWVITGSLLEVVRLLLRPSPASSEGVSTEPGLNGL